MEICLIECNFSRTPLHETRRILIFSNRDVMLRIWKESMEVDDLVEHLNEHLNGWTMDDN